MLDEQPWTYDVEKARQILTDAGIEGGTITTRVRDLREYVDVAQTLQASMAQVGLTLEIEQMTGAQVLDAYRAREVPIFLGEWARIIRTRTPMPRPSPITPTTATRPPPWACWPGATPMRCRPR